MALGRVCATITVLAAIALGASAPAWAAEMSGSYSAQEIGDPAEVWTFTPCGNGCAEVVFADGRTAQARVDQGQWRVDDVGNDTAIKCTADGTESTGSAHYSWDPTTYSWDPTTLAGQVWATDDTGACGVLPGTDTVGVPFNLTQAG
jgi:hypothetical protein